MSKDNINLRVTSGEYYLLDQVLSASIEYLDVLDTNTVQLQNLKLKLEDQFEDECN